MMSRYEILYYLRQWHEDGLFSINYDGIDKSGLADKMSKLEWLTPYTLLLAVNHAVKKGE